jgi:hypothetical protein
MYSVIQDKRYGNGYPNWYCWPEPFTFLNPGLAKPAGSSGLKKQASTIRYYL